MLAFWQSLAFIALAEMGDKTQLVALAFAARYPARLVIGGITAATLVVHLVSVGLGEALGIAFPRQWIGTAAGLAFIGFGIWTLRGDSLDEADRSARSRFGPFLTVAVTFFLAELGDKTMLATVTIASQQRSFVAVWLGSTFGMVLADGLAIVLGSVAGKRLPERAIQLVSAGVFIVSGVATIAGAWLALGPLSGV